MIMEKQRIGDVSSKDIWAFAFRCVGVMLFPILFLMPLILLWRLFFYNPEDFWGIVRVFILYVAVVVLGVWLCSFKTVLEEDRQNLYVIKKWCFLFGITARKIPFKDIKTITFEEVSLEDTKLKIALKKVFRLKLFYGFLYKLGGFLISKGRVFVSIVYGDHSEVIEITDIKKNDERYQYLQGLQKGQTEGNKWNDNDLTN